MRSKNRLPKWTTTVTWWTKILALAMYIILPIVGFYIGVWFGKTSF